MTEDRRPLLERLTELIPTGSYHSDGYGSSTGEHRPATPVMRSANRDGHETVQLLSALLESLRSLRDETHERVCPEITMTFAKIEHDPICARLTALIETTEAA